mmetsp:Transcript_36347/g.65998  ORF Transcript_36347/g.65998 Transcript_36347/m.65998 type:complete len:211 (-) Transcript_36347:839-1471(-)
MPLLASSAVFQFSLQPEAVGACFYLSSEAGAFRLPPQSRSRLETSRCPNAVPLPGSRMELRTFPDSTSAARPRASMLCLQALFRAQPPFAANPAPQPLHLPALGSKEEMRPRHLCHHGVAAQRRAFPLSPLSFPSLLSQLSVLLRLAEAHPRPCFLDVSVFVLPSPLPQHHLLARLLQAKRIQHVLCPMPPENQRRFQGLAIAAVHRPRW